MPLSSQDRKAMVWFAIALLCIAFFFLAVMAQSQTMTLPAIDPKHANDKASSVAEPHVNASNIDYSMKLGEPCRAGETHVLTIEAGKETAAVGVTCNFKGEWGRPWTARIK